MQCVAEILALSVDKDEEQAVKKNDQKMSELTMIII
jgi:hypothetical protein